VNWRHLQTFVWLRWRLVANQWRRAGKLSAVLMTVVTAVAVVSTVPLLVGGFAFAIYTIPKATPAQLMYAWDALVCLFLFFWAIGLMTELQRNDPLSLSKFLHLPVSVTGAFLINYASSLLRLSLVIFGPLMAAFALALVYVGGVKQLPVLPSLAAFFLMVTALTYQFQGWLASLMSNPRRRRTVLVVSMMVFIMTFQLPNLLNLYAMPKRERRRAEFAAAREAELGALRRGLEAKQFDVEEYSRRQAEVTGRHEALARQASRNEVAVLERSALVANTVLPVGWLPMGVMASAEGRAGPALLGLAGMTLIGAASLGRAYRTAVGQYQGQATNRKGRAPAARPAGDRGPRVRMLEARLPGLSEPVSAVALGGLQSLLRSPESKIALLTPLIMGAVFGTMLAQGGHDIPASLRPLAAVAAILCVLFGLLQLMANQFGVDRDGFRVFVLCSAPRRAILLGKNLAYLPAALGISALLLAGVQFLCPMRFDQILSMAPQFVSMYLLFCMLANLFSIYAPVYNTAGTLKPANPKLTTVLLQLVMFMVLFPLSQGLTLIPFGAEAALHALGRAEGVPVGLLLALAECAAVVVLYRASLGWLGAGLQAREQEILETVTNRAL